MTDSSPPESDRRLSAATTNTAHTAATDDHLYFRQLLAGRDFAVGDSIATQMVNFVYLIGDRATGEALVVDPAYGVDELLDVLAADEMTCVGALATHYHPDHVGGDMMGWTIEGIARLLETASVPVHVQAAEVPWVTRSTGVEVDDLVAHEGGDVVMVGNVPVTLVHTPAIPPGASASWLTGDWSRGHPVPGRLWSDRPAWWGPCSAVRVVDHAAGSCPERHCAVPGPPLLRRTVGHAGRYPSQQLCVPPEDAGAVDDGVRPLSTFGR